MQRISRPRDLLPLFCTLSESLALFAVRDIMISIIQQKSFHILLNQHEVHITDCTKSIHPLSLSPLILFRVTGGLEPIQADIGQKAGSILDKSPVHCMAAIQRRTNTHSHSHTSKGNLESAINLTCTSLDCGKKPEYSGEPTQTWWEHANSTQIELPRGCNCTEPLFERMSTQAAVYILLIQGKRSITFHYAYLFLMF